MICHSVTAGRADLRERPAQPGPALGPAFAPAFGMDGSGEMGMELLS
jgi:hypothetical protein